MNVNGNKIFYLTKTFTFDSAHNLIKYNGKCERLHGHTYRLDVTIQGRLNSEEMVLDFVEFKSIVKDNVIDLIDHTYLNDILEQPSTENLVLWIWNKLSPLFDSDNYKLFEIKLWETQTSSVSFRG